VGLADAPGGWGGGPCRSARAEGAQAESLATELTAAVPARWSVDGVLVVIFGSPRIGNTTIVVKQSPT